MNVIGGYSTMSKGLATRRLTLGMKKTMAVHTPTTDQF